MATITITVPNGVVAEVGNYVALSQGYTGKKPNGDPETKGEFITRRLTQTLKDWAATGKRIEAEQGVNEASYGDSLGITGA